MKADPQHPLQRQRLRAVTGLRVVRLNQIQYRVPRDHHVHLRQESLPARHLALAILGL